MQSTSTTTAVLDEANEEAQNMDQDAVANALASNSDDQDNHRLIIMIIAVCAVLILFVIIIGCYWKLRERRARQKKSPTLSFDGNPSLSTSLLIGTDTQQSHDNDHDHVVKHTQIEIPDQIQTGQTHTRNVSQMTDSTLGLAAISPPPRREFGRKRSNGYDINVALSMSRSRSDAYQAQQADPNHIKEKSERSVTDSVPFSMSRTDGILQDLDNDNNRESVEYSHDRKLIAQRYNQCTLFPYVQ